MTDDIEEITIKITKHAIQQIQDRKTTKRKNIEEFLKSIFEQQNIVLHEGKNRDNFLFILPSEGCYIPSVLVLIQDNKNLFVVVSSYRTPHNISKHTRVRKFFVSGIILPELQKTPRQLLDEEIELLETRKKNINVQINHLNKKVSNIDTDIQKLEDKKDTLR